MFSINKDAIMTISVNTGILQKLQESLVYLMSERSSEEIKNFKILLENGKTDELSPWMETVSVISILVKNIEDNAIKNNQVNEITD